MHALEKPPETPGKQKILVENFEVDLAVVTAEASFSR